MDQHELDSALVMENQCANEINTDGIKKTDVEGLIDSLPLPSVAWDW